MASGQKWFLTIFDHSQSILDDFWDILKDFCVPDAKNTALE